MADYIEIENSLTISAKLSHTLGNYETVNLFHYLLTVVVLNSTILNSKYARKISDVKILGI